MKRLISAAVLSVMLTAFVSVPIGAAEVSAHAAILIETNTGDIVFEKNSRERLPMASTTKIMTAITVLENAGLDDIVTVSENACGIEGSSIYLVPGEKHTVNDLLYAVMLESANDAAAALACHVSGSVEKFAVLMNETAAKIGLEDSSFTNPHGLDDDNHYTTAADLARLMAYAMKNPDFRRITETEKYTIPSSDDSGTRFLSNHNRLLRMSEYVTGGKTGFTKRCGRCLVSSAEQNGVSLIAVTLNAPDDWNDHLALHDLGFSSYSGTLLAEIGEFTLNVPCPGAPDGKLTVSNREELSAVLRNGSEFHSVIESRPLFFPPVSEGDVCGTVTFFCDDKVIGKVNLYADESVSIPADTRSIGRKILDFIR